MTLRCTSDIVDNPQVQDLRRTGGGSYSVDNPQMQCGTHPLDNPQVQDPPLGQPSGAGPTIWTTLRCRTHHLDNPQVQDPPFGQPPGAGPTIWTTPRYRTHHLYNPQVQQDSPFGQPSGARPTLGATLRGKTTKHRTTLRYPFLLPVLAHPQVWTKGLTHPQVLRGGGLANPQVLATLTPPSGWDPPC